MSTLRVNNLQIGQSGTAAQNFTLYQPTTPDGTLRLAVGNSGATTGDVLSVSNTGLSVTGTLSATGNVSFDGGTFVFNESGADKDFRIEGDTDANLFFTDASTGRVGIGTSSPAAKLTVLDTTANAATALVRLLGQSNYNLDIQSVTNSVGTVGNRYNFDIGSGGGEFSFSNSGGERVRIGSGGEVYFLGVGTTASAANAYLNNGSTPANQLLRSTSSLRYKTDVETLDHAKADAVLNLRPVWYRSKAEADRKDWSWYGLIAEEVAQVEPRLVHWSYPEDQFETIETQTEIEKTREVEVTPAVLDDEGNVVEPAVTETETYTETETKSERKLKADAQLAPDGVQYDRLTVMLLDIVKRQNQRIEQLEAKVAALEAQ